MSLRNSKKGWWILAVAVLAVPVVVAGWVGYRSYSRQAAIEAIEQAGGRIRYRAKPAPQWLRAIPLDVDFSSREVVYVHLEGRSLTDAKLADLMDDLQQFDNLHGLAFNRTAITDRGLGIVPPSLPQLEGFSLQKTPVTDVGLMSLIHFKRLKLLHIVNIPISDQGMPYVGGLRDLRVLMLKNTEITDDGLKQIHQLPKLETLFLDHNQITDKGLLNLTDLQNLDQLSVVNTGVTEEGIRELKKHLPKLAVSDD